MKISVVIRTRDREKYFDDLLENLAFQTIRPSEIIIVDNFSSKEKVKDMERAIYYISKQNFSDSQTKIKLVTISDKDFSHPYSTNLGVNTAENEFVCITNAHSLPISICWLESGSEHFEDQKVAGVSGFFSPHMKGNVGGKICMMLYHFSQMAILRMDWLSTINCIIRKSLWRQYPFDENLSETIPETKRYGLEDYDWSKEMSARGFDIVIDPLFSVYHSHGKGFDEVTRNVRNYFVYRKLQKQISLFARPRESFSKVMM